MEKLEKLVLSLSGGANIKLLGGEHDNEEMATIELTKEGTDFCDVRIVTKNTAMRIMLKVGIGCVGIVHERRKDSGERE